MLYVLDFPSATTHGPPAQSCLLWEAGPIRTLSIHFIRCCRWAAQARIENAFPWTAKRGLSMSLILVTGGAWALCLAKLVLLRLVCSPDSSQDSQALDTQGRNGPASQHRRPAQPTNCAKRRAGAGAGARRTNQLRASFKFSHRRLLHWAVLRHNELHGPCPSRTPTASDGRFSLLLENELCFILFFDGRAHRCRREKTS
jgi:hypothetical protein